MELIFILTISYLIINLVGFLLFGLVYSLRKSNKTTLLRGILLVIVLNVLLMLLLVIAVHQPDLTLTTPFFVNAGIGFVALFFGLLIRNIFYFFRHKGKVRDFTANT